jgi:type I restriction enzyme S subunit
MGTILGNTPFNRYSSYKDSGVEWLGEIPSSWSLTRLGTRFEERKTKVSDKDFPPLSVTKNGTIPQLDSAAKSNDGDNRKLVKTGDFVINSRSDRKGSSGIASQDGSVSLIYIVIEPKGINPTYCNYLLKSYNFVEEFYRMGHGIVADLWTTHYDEMKAIVLGIPTIEEQTAIADFLDRKTALIDHAIEIKQKQIELLKERRQILIHKAVTRGLNPNVKMKDSGVEWIGEIPQGWEVKKMKYLGIIKYGLGQPPKEKENGLPLIRATNVERGKIVEKGLIYVDPDDIPWERDPMLNENDIIIVRSGAYTADSAIITKKHVGSIAGYDMVFTPKTVYPSFISFALLAKYILFDQLYLVRMRAAQPHLNAEELGETLVLCPSLSEQVSISEQIELVSEKIFTAIYLKEQEIEKLKEYKATLINSAVTGKIKVYSDAK